MRAGVEPRNILAITFTRKAAAEMRDRILTNLRRAADEGSFDAARWRALRDHLPDVAISTIDAFCLSLLREFPLEADLDPGFGMADETEALRLVDEAVDRTMRICRATALKDPSVALVLARLGDWQLRAGLRSLIDRRLVAADVLARAMRPIPESLTPVGTAHLLIERLQATLSSTGVDAFIRSGPLHHPKFRLLAADLRRLVHSVPPDNEAAFRMARLLVDGLRDYFLTREGVPRKRLAYPKGDFPDERARRAHLELVTSLAPRIADDLGAFRRDVNAVLTRGVWHVFAIARKEYRRTLDQHAVVDFPEALARALDLLGAMGEFTESRFVLESRYHHLLVDEFQDTSDAQWRLVWQLVKSWREGRGVADDLPLEPTIFVVGDRKQSIYGFRDADVGVLMRAAGYVSELRGGDERFAARSGAASAPCRRFSRSPTRCSTPSTRSRIASTRSPTKTRTAFRSTTAKIPESPCSESLRLPTGPGRPAPSPPRSPDFWRAGRCATGRPASREPRVPGISASCFARAKGTRTLNARSRLGASAAMCTRASASSTPTKSRMS